VVCRAVGRGRRAQRRAGARSGLDDGNLRRAALDLRLTSDDIAELDDAFPPPAGLRPLEVI
jgi:hypothetical protein